MVVPGKLSRSPRGTHHGIIVEKPQPWEWPGRSLIGPCPRERTQRNTHGRLIQAECSTGVNGSIGANFIYQQRRRVLGLVERGAQASSAKRVAAGLACKGGDGKSDVRRENDCIGAFRSYVGDGQHSPHL
jgi:hypothetical protein